MQPSNATFNFFEGKKFQTKHPVQKLFVQLPKNCKIKKIYNGFLCSWKTCLCHNHLNLWFLIVKTRGESRIFSRGGGRILKKFSKILTTFFFIRSTKLIFRALPKHCFAPILAKFSAPQANFLKNSQKKLFLGTF